MVLSSTKLQSKYLSSWANLAMNSDLLFNRLLESSTQTEYIYIYIYIYISPLKNNVKRCTWHDTKPHLMVRLQFWRVWCTSSLLLLPDPLRPRIVVPVRVQSTDEIGLFKNC